MSIDGCSADSACMSQDTLFHVFEEDATLCQFDCCVREMRANLLWHKVVRVPDDNDFWNDVLNEDDRMKGFHRPVGFEPDEFLQCFEAYHASVASTEDDEKFTSRMPYMATLASSLPPPINTAGESASSLPPGASSSSSAGAIDPQQRIELDIADIRKEAKYMSHLVSKGAMEVEDPPPPVVPTPKKSDEDRMTSQRVPDILDRDGNKIRPPIFESGKAFDYHVQIRAANDLVRIAHERKAGNIVALHTVTGRGDRFRGLYSGTRYKYKYNLAWMTYSVVGMRCLKQGFEHNMLPRGHFDQKLTDWLMTPWANVDDHVKRAIVEAKIMKAPGDYYNENADVFYDKAFMDVPEGKDVTIGDIVGSCLTVPTCGHTCNHVSSTTPSDGDTNTMSSFHPEFVAQDLTTAKIAFVLWNAKKKTGLQQQKKWKITGWPCFLHNQFRPQYARETSLTPSTVHSQTT